MSAVDLDINMVVRARKQPLPKRWGKKCTTLMAFHLLGRLPLKCGQDEKRSFMGQRVLSSTLPYPWERQAEKMRVISHSPVQAPNVAAERSQVLSVGIQRSSWVQMRDVLFQALPTHTMVLPSKTMTGEIAGKGQLPSKAISWSQRTKRCPPSARMPVEPHLPRLRVLTWI